MEQCSHTALAFKIEGGKTLWHCANCLRTFLPSGDTGAEQECVRLRRKLETVLQLLEADIKFVKDAVSASGDDHG